jgi:carboxymethylenebutenolidase
MGDMVEFDSNGSQAGGYLAVPESGAGPGVLVIQEWWGLVPQLKGVCDRLALEGFVALAPDLFHGEFAEHHEMDKAGELMSNLPAERVALDMIGAVDHLLADARVTGEAVGVVGFCMGGLLALEIAASAGDKVAAAAPFYGAPLGDGAPDWSGLTATVRGHFAGSDDFFPPEAVAALEQQLRNLGSDVTLEVHPGSGHGFTNEENPLGNYDAELTASTWAETVSFLRTTL